MKHKLLDLTLVSFHLRVCHEYLDTGGRDGSSVQLGCNAEAKRGRFARGRRGKEEIERFNHKTS